MFTIGTFLLVVLWRLFLAYHNANLRKSGISFFLEIINRLSIKTTNRKFWVSIQYTLQFFTFLSYQSDF